MNLVIITSSTAVFLPLSHTENKCERTKIDTSFHQRLPNLVQRLFADVILTTILPILFLYLNTVIVTAGTFEP